MIRAMLSTVDNPYDPFVDFDSWFSWDERSGYHSSGLLARIVKTSDELSVTDQALAIESAIDEIVDENVLGVSIKVTREVPDP